MLWNQTYGEANGETCYSVVETSDGGFALSGYTISFGAGGGDVWLVKTDSAGNLLWSQTYGGTNWDTGYSVVTTSDGGYIIAGSTNSYGAGGSDFWLIKTDSTGVEQWSQTYGGTSMDESHSVIATSDGGYAIAGSTRSYGAGSTDVYLVKTDELGNATEGSEFILPLLILALAIAIIVIIVIVISKKKSPRKNSEAS
jgi:predicted secreted protein